MPFVVSEGPTRVLVPAGQYVAVGVDIVDLGMVESTYKDKKRTQHKCRLVFELNENDAEGRPLICSRYFTASLNEKADLRGFLEQWRGKPFTAEELKGFDLEVLLGVNALIQIVHAEKGGKTYDNISSVMKLPKGMKWLEPSGKYIRVKDRKDNGNGAVPDDGAPPPDDDDGPDATPF